MVVLREYQREAVTAALETHEHQLIVLPTGSGKSLVAASILADATSRGNRCMLLTHRKELIAQDSAALARVAPQIAQGVFSASLGRKEPDPPVVFAQVQSAVNALPSFGHRDLLLIDEAHLIPRDMDTTYGAVLSHFNRAAQRIGLTATPYRLDSGRLDEGEGRLFDVISYQATARDLVADGFLSPLVGLVSMDAVSTAGVHIRRGDFVPGELEDVLLDERLVNIAADDVSRNFSGRVAALVFCVTVAHAKAVCAALQARGVSAIVVHGGLPGNARDDALEALRSGAVRALVNVDVLTTGVDLPMVDTLAILRPTMSKGLHVQMLGRGMRLSPSTGKTGCLVLDYARNCKRHGDIDELGFDSYRDIPQEKRDREAAEQTQAARKLYHRQTADIDPFGQLRTSEVGVHAVSYEVWPANKYPGKNNLVAVYSTDAGRIRQWVCLEYDGYAAQHARRWFSRRGIIMPPTAAQARIELQRHGTMPKSLTIDTSEKYAKVIVEHWE